MKIIFRRAVCTNKINYCIEQLYVKAILSINVQKENVFFIFHQKKIDVEYEILKKNERKSIEHRVYNGITQSRAENEKILLWNEKNR